MRKINKSTKTKIPKYPEGGTTDKTLETSAEKQGVTMPTSWNFDDYYSRLNKYQTINASSSDDAADIKYYQRAYVVPQIKTYQQSLNTALYTKYNLPAGSAITDQFLTPEEANTALNGNYGDYMKYIGAYQDYRTKTPDMPKRELSGNLNPSTDLYGTRHVNLFSPYTTPTPTPTAPVSNTQLPQQANGGLFNGRILDGLQDLNGEKIKNGIGNYGKALADSALSTYGLSNVIQDDMYKGNSADEFAQIGNTMGKLSGTLAPMAANIAAPGSGQFIKMGQQAIGSFNPEQEEQFSQGGMYMGQPNAEVEKQEVMQMPNGTTEQADGPSHESGGIPVNLPQSTRIFSDRLKMNGKTFAKLAAKYKTDKDEKVLSDKSSNGMMKKTAELNMSNKNKKLDEIFTMQESMKANKINSYIKKYGGTQKYPHGGTTPPTEEQWMSQQNTNPFYIMSPNELYPPQPTDFMGSIQGQYDNNGIPVNPQYNPQQIQNTSNQQLNTNYTQPTINQTVQEYSPESSSSNNMLDKAKDLYGNNKEMIGKVGTEVGIGLLNNIGNLAYLGQQGKKYDTVDYGKVTPNYLSDEASQRAISEGYSTGAYNLRNSGQQTQAGQIALANNRMRQSADSKERIGNINTQIGNQAAYANQGYKMQGMDNTAANKGQAQTNYYNALSGMGQNVAAQRGDYLNKQMDAKKMNLVKSIFPDYTFDEKTFQYMYNKAKQAK